jgi:hypothetical protein
MDAREQEDEADRSRLEAMAEQLRAAAEGRPTAGAPGGSGGYQQPTA